LYFIGVDYSDDPGYWSEIVNRPAGRKSKREIQETVDREHSGSYKSYLDHQWRLDRRSTPEHELHLLHKRWFSQTLADWLSNFRKIDIEYDLIRHTVNEQFRWYLFRDSIQCTLAGIPTQAYFAAWADLNINIETAGVLSLIGNLADLSTFQESHVLFRNKGSVKASLNLEAFAELQFSTGTVELVGSLALIFPNWIKQLIKSLGAANFGATFTVPGFVTIGPNFRVLGSLDGIATLHA
jgi:chitinase